MPRSYLFVPGDSEKKLTKGLAGDADALIIDLEDAVAPSNKDAGRQLTAQFLTGQWNARARLWVRVNAFVTGLTESDLAAVAAVRVHHQLLPSLVIFQEPYAQLDAATIAALEQRGYKLEQQDYNGDIQAIAVRGGEVTAAPDPRGTGVGRVIH